MARAHSYMSGILPCSVLKMRTVYRSIVWRKIRRRFRKVYVCFYFQFVLGLSGFLASENVGPLCMPRRGMRPLVSCPFRRTARLIARSCVQSHSHMRSLTSLDRA